MDKFNSNKIKELRELNHITQKKLGDLLGISDRAVSKWESGMTMPDVMMLPDIAKMFNVSIDDLYCCDKITDDNVKEINKAGDNRILVISVEDKNSVVKTRVPIKVIQALLTNEKVRDEIDLDEKERTLIDNVLNSSQCEIVNIGNGEKKTRIALEDYEA